MALGNFRKLQSITTEQIHPVLNW